MKFITGPNQDGFPFKGTVQRKLTGVLSGINRKLMIWDWAAWGLFYILRGLGP
jgi:hypothetical protein